MQGDVNPSHGPRHRQHTPGPLGQSHEEVLSLQPLQDQPGPSRHLDLLVQTRCRRGLEVRCLERPALPLDQRRISRGTRQLQHAAGIPLEDLRS